MKRIKADFQNLNQVYYFDSENGTFSHFVFANLNGFIDITEPLQVVDYCMQLEHAILELPLEK